MGSYLNLKVSNQGFSIIHLFNDCSKVLDMSESLIIITGPTATGKTSVAETIAEKLDGEIISADSRIMYRGLDIGTGKYTLSKNIRYHMVDVLDIGQRNTSHDFVTKTRKITRDILDRGKKVIICGGSIELVYRYLKGMDPSPRPDPELRLELEKSYVQNGAEQLWEYLYNKDPELAKRVHPNNKQRMIRYLERSLLTTYEDNIEPIEMKYICLFSCMDRDIHKDKIKNRVYEMFEMGWVDEIRSLLEKGYSPNDAGFDSIGYRYIADRIVQGKCLNGTEKAIICMTWNYAKRQMNWRKRVPSKDLRTDVNTVQDIVGSLLND